MIFLCDTLLIVLLMCFENVTPLAFIGLEQEQGLCPGAKMFCGTFVVIMVWCRLGGDINFQCQMWFKSADELSPRQGGLLRVHCPTLAGSGYRTIKVAADSTVVEVKKDKKINKTERQNGKKTKRYVLSKLPQTPLLSR